jgi:hypothetical protein
VKVRVLRFDLGSEQDHLHFRCLYEGFFGGAATQEKRGMAVARAEAKVLDKLDPVSVPRTENGMAFLRVLRERPGETVEIELEQLEYDLILKYLDTAGWAPMHVRAARDLDDWLRAAPVREKE